MAKPNHHKSNKNKAASTTAALENLLAEEIRLREVAEKSGVDFDRIAKHLRELTGTNISKELLIDSWDLTRVLLAEACELRDRSMIHYIINEIIKRKEPKQQQIKTDIEIDHKVLVLIQGIEGETVEELIARRNAITVGDGKARPVGAIPDRRGSGKERS